MDDQLDAANQIVSTEDVDLVRGTLLDYHLIFRRFVYTQRIGGAVNQRYEFTKQPVYAFLNNEPGQGEPSEAKIWLPRAWKIMASCIQKALQRADREPVFAQPRPARTGAAVRKHAFYDSAFNARLATACSSAGDPFRTGDSLRPLEPSSLF